MRVLSRRRNILKLHTRSRYGWELHANESPFCPHAREKTHRQSSNSLRLSNRTPLFQPLLNCGRGYGKWRDIYEPRSRATLTTCEPSSLNRRPFFVVERFFFQPLGSSFAQTAPIPTNAQMLSACLVVDVLPVDVRASLVARHVAKELKDYRRIFRVTGGSFGSNTSVRLRGNFLVFRCCR